MSSKLEEEGYRLTAARLAILAGLIDSEGHVSADELVDIVRQKHPGVGRMTVYRTLDLLTELGLIRPVFHGSAAAQYVLMDEGHHHHLVCSRCNQVIEFDQCVLREIEQTVSNHYGFEIHGHLLEIYGRCLACQD
jgi:Fur family ferric uptake transcriptional regulator